MKSKKYYLWIIGIIIFSLAMTGTGLAQEWATALSYQMSLPGGDTKDFIGATSFRGMGLDVRYKIDPDTRVGMFFGWNVFYERVEETVELQTDHPGAVTGTHDRYLNAYPIMLSVQRFFGQAGGMQPYAGLNLGGFIMSQKFDIGLSSLSNDQWQWGGAPELGVIIPLNYDASLMINGKYNYAFTGESVLGQDINNSYWVIGIGVAWEGY